MPGLSYAKEQKDVTFQKILRGLNLMWTDFSDFRRSVCRASSLVCPWLIKIADVFAIPVGKYYCTIYSGLFYVNILYKIYRIEDLFFYCNKKFTSVNVPLFMKVTTKRLCANFVFFFFVLY